MKSKPKLTKTQMTTTTQPPPPYQPSITQLSPVYHPFQHLIIQTQNLQNQTKNNTKSTQNNLKSTQTPLENPSQTQLKINPKQNQLKIKPIPIQKLREKERKRQIRCSCWCRHCLWSCCRCHRSYWCRWSCVCVCKGKGFGMRDGQRFEKDKMREILMKRYIIK